MLPKWYEVLAEQLLNSAVVAGISALGMLLATQAIPLNVVVINFLLTMLIEIRKYRKI